MQNVSRTVGKLQKKSINLANSSFSLKVRKQFSSLTVRTHLYHKHAAVLGRAGPTAAVTSFSSFSGGKDNTNIQLTICKGLGKVRLYMSQKIIKTLDSGLDYSLQDRFCHALLVANHGQQGLSIRVTKRGKYIFCNIISGELLYASIL
jgi:hypothetical protein